MSQQEGSTTHNFDDLGRAPDAAPAFVVHGSFENRYGDGRTAVETPAPWDVPDDMTDANDVVKSLPWGEDDVEDDDDREGAHFSFEDRVPRLDAEKVWLIDSEYVDDLRQMAEDAGYDWESDPHPDEGPSEAEQRLGELAGTLEEIEREFDDDGYTEHGGDVITVRYTSKQTGSEMEKTGRVNAATDRTDSRRLTTGIVVVTEDDKTYKLRVDEDSGTVALYSTSQYPFMGKVFEVEVQQ